MRNRWNNFYCCSMYNFIQIRFEAHLPKGAHLPNGWAGLELIPESKTAHIIPELEKSEYKREPIKVVMSLTKDETKTLIIARFGMLECGKNYKGTLNESCLTCNVEDNEEHRLNGCLKFREINYVDCDERIPLRNIYSDDLNVLKLIMKRINTTWNLKIGHGSMN